MIKYMDIWWKFTVASDIRPRLWVLLSILIVISHQHSTLDPTLGAWCAVVPGGGLRDGLSNHVCNVDESLMMLRSTHDVGAWIPLHFTEETFFLFVEWCQGSIYVHEQVIIIPYRYHFPIFIWEGIPRSIFIRDMFKHCWYYVWMNMLRWCLDYV